MSERGSVRLTLLSLPDTLLRNVVCAFLDGKQLVRLSATSKRLRAVCDGHSVVWRRVLSLNYPGHVALQAAATQSDSDVQQTQTHADAQKQAMVAAAERDKDAKLSDRDGKETEPARVRVNWQRLYGELEASVHHFNRNAKEWETWFLRLFTEDSAPVPRFLLAHFKRLDRASLRAYLTSFSARRRCTEFLRLALDFRCVDFDWGLRAVCVLFSLNGAADAEQIDRIFESFCNVFVEQNPGKLDSNAHTPAELGYILSFSLAILSTDLHARVLMNRRSTLSSWTTSLHGTIGTLTNPTRALRADSLYYSIQTCELAFCNEPAQRKTGWLIVESERKFWFSRKQRMLCVLAEGKCSLFSAEIEHCPALVIDLVNPPTDACAKLTANAQTTATKTETKRDAGQTKQVRSDAKADAKTMASESESESVCDVEKEYPVRIELRQQHDDYCLLLRYYQRTQRFFVPDYEDPDSWLRAFRWNIFAKKKGLCQLERLFA